jgi:hypothetical protein
LLRCKDIFWICWQLGWLKGGFKGFILAVGLCWRMFVTVLFASIKNSKWNFCRYWVWPRWVKLKETRFLAQFLSSNDMTEVYLIQIGTSCDHILYLYCLQDLLNGKAQGCFTIASLDRCSCSKDVISHKPDFLWLIMSVCEWWCVWLYVGGLQKISNLLAGIDVIICWSWLHLKICQVPFSSCEKEKRQSPKVMADFW